MKKFFALLCTGLMLITYSARADEGMWLLTLLEQLNIKKMNAMGCKLSAEDIYSINHASLKDAIIIFGNGCTGEIVSDQGLILTNHHCGYEAIQSHSSLEHDYLSEGFWAQNKSEELYTPDLKVTFLVRIEDVTNQINAVLKEGMKEDERQSAIEGVKEKIKSEATAGTHYEASVDDFFGGNNYYLIVYEVYNDVRMVGTPPNSIGNFGYDTDNWMWPRHTGDFSVFRVYSGPDGKPAPYSKDNVPLKPKHFLPVSMKGVQKGDFTMVMGYPGSTERYITSYEVKEMMEITNPNRVKIRGTRQDIMMKDMLADPKVRIQYASKYSISSNYWKYSIGQNQGLKNLDVVNRKQHDEQEFLDWANADPERKKEYGNVLSTLETAINARRPYTHAFQYLSECLQASEIMLQGIKYYRLYSTMAFTPDSTAQIKEQLERIRKEKDDFFKNFNPETDKKVSAAIFKLYSENVQPEYLPEFIKEVGTKYKGDFSKYVNYLFKKSLLIDQAKTEAFLNKPTKEILAKDPGFKATMDFLSMYFTLNNANEQFDNVINPSMRKYIAGTIEKNQDKTYYPDANFTMRLTYGTVGDYKARDAVYYDYFTTLAGVMEKEDTSNFEFKVSPRLKELYKNKDYGRYAAEDGKLHLCFTTNNDITGGNSGSPVMNGNGELIGLAFDGNWEAMSGDVVYEPLIQKCICVDIRYVLFVMDKFSGAKHLVDEMKLVY